jgi:hypothetical protein
VVILYLMRAIIEYTPAISNPIQFSLSNVSELIANFCGKLATADWGVAYWHSGTA